jgi:hypothetical protein
VPVIFNGVLFRPNVKALPGRPSYNEAIKKLVPAIHEARKNGHHAVGAIASYLNAKGITAPSGRPFSYATLHSILLRLWELGLADPSRSKTEAAQQKPRYRFRPGCSKTLRR